MYTRTFLIFMTLWATVLLSGGFDPDLAAQTTPPNPPSASNPGEPKGGVITNKNSRAYKRMQMVIEQAEWARIRAEKIKAGNQGNPEPPK